MSLKAMAENVRAEKRRALAAAPAVRRENARRAVIQEREAKRRAWERSRRIFECAFGRQFSPHRFTYEVGHNNGYTLVKVSINFEGKLLAYCEVYLGEGNRTPTLYVQPLDESEPAKSLQVGYDALYDALAKLVEKWELA